ncbi:MAG: hypothetical protein ABIP51_08290 [Bacteroidia bacterium]
MAKAPTKDELITQLLGVVNSKKAEIAKAEKPSWETNGSFSRTGSASDKVNIQVETNINFFIESLAFLLMAKEYANKAAIMLGVTPVPFKHQNYTDEQWALDFTTRINKIQISEKKKELANLEERLSKLISPEERERLELAELMDSVSKL